MKNLIDYFRTHDTVIVLFWLALVVGASLFWDAKYARRASTEPLHSVEFMLHVCSPFTDAEERRMLEFDGTNGTVELSEILALSSTNPTETVFSSKDLTKTRGTFTISEATETVLVTLGSQPSEYIAFMPGDQCILVHGSLRSANLSASWYGTADYSSGK